MMRAAATLAAAALALGALDAHAINKCIDRKGKVSYQNTPCPESSKQEKVTVMPGPAPSTKGGTAAKPPMLTPGGTLVPSQDVADPRMDALVSTMATYEGCESADPAFAKANAAKYQAWRGENAELLDRLPKSQRYMKTLQLERSRVQWQLGQPAARKALADSCPSKLGPILSTKTSK